MGYNMHDNCFKGTFSNDAWRISEAAITFRDLPKSIGMSYVGKSVSEICSLDHLVDRKIKNYKETKNKGYRHYLEMDEPEKHEIEQGEWKND